MKLNIRKFEKADQDDVKELILSGLKEHWGTLDPDYNKDLDDIFLTYQNEIFLTAWNGDKLVGTGAAIILNNGKAQIMRMSVAKSMRRKGIGKKILEVLIEELKKVSVKDIILETTETWNGAIRFYRNFGFEITHKKEGDIYFHYTVI